jgi:hypothetical protein
MILAGDCPGSPEVGSGIGLNLTNSSRHNHPDGIVGQRVSALSGLGDSLVAVHLVPALDVAVHAGSAIRQISWRVTNPILS